MLKYVRLCGVDHYSITGLRFVGVAEPTQLSTRAAGLGDAVHRHDGSPYIERRHDALTREPLRRLFPVASALSAVHRRSAIMLAKPLGYGRARSTGTLRQRDSLRVFAGRPVEVGQQPYAAEG